MSASRNACLGLMVVRSVFTNPFLKRAEWMLSGSGMPPLRMPEALRSGDHCCG
jgi:hypothetical protein